MSRDQSTISLSRRRKPSTRYPMGGINTRKFSITKTKSHKCSPPPYMSSSIGLSIGTAA
ncbi:MAG: hypothetical protein J6Z16_03290 [Candidatus Methanomethylophilaceae archaeon]|nr:hypothetical protein [Candidatus Methanomethylophilaceae archaeon]